MRTTDDCFDDIRWKVSGRLWLDLRGRWWFDGRRRRRRVRRWWPPDLVRLAAHYSWSRRWFGKKMPNR